MRTCKEPMLTKLGLSKKHPRIGLFSRKSVLDAGLILLNILIAVLKFKLRIEKKRRLGNATNSMKIQEGCQEIESTWLIF